MAENLDDQTVHYLLGRINGLELAVFALNMAVPQNERHIVDQFIDSFINIIEKEASSSSANPSYQKGKLDTLQFLKIEIPSQEK